MCQTVVMRVNDPGEIRMIHALKCRMLTTHKVQLRVIGGIVVGLTGMYGMFVMLYRWVDAGTAGI